MMHRQSFKSLSWLHIHSSLILCSLFPPKLFILSTLCCVFFTSCHSGKRRSRSGRYSSSSCPCFHPPGAAHFLPPLAFMEPYEASPSRFGGPPPSQPDTFHSCHTKVTMRSVHKCFLGSECPQWAVLSPGNQARSYFKSSPTCIALQIKITLHSSRKQHPT